MKCNRFSLDMLFNYNNNDKIVNGMIFNPISPKCTLEIIIFVHPSGGHDGCQKINIY